MAEDKRANPFPYPTATEVLAAPGGRELKAARNIVTRYIEGIPKRGFILGDNDHSAIMRGVQDLTTEVYTLLDSLDGVMNPQIESVRAMLEHHGCPDTAPIPTGEG